MGPAAPERGLAFHKPEKQVGSCLSGFQESALLPSFLGLGREALVLRELTLEKRGPADAKRGAHYVLSSAVFLGWKMCHGGKNNEGAEISAATESPETGLVNKARLSVCWPHPLLLGVLHH